MSSVSQVFDPIGFNFLFTLCPKILLQKSWKGKAGWDSEVPEDTEKNFWKWLDELPLLSEVKIPRYLHVFCDASKVAYAAAVFLRGQRGKEIYSKSRVVSLQNLTIPRLELLACCIVVRLASSLKNTINVEIRLECFWTGSTTALFWIQSGECCGNSISNRVKEINLLTEHEAWYHVSGQENPVDLPSCRCSNDWPQLDSLVNEEEVNQERKLSVITTLVDVTDEVSWYCTYFSRYSKILTMVVWILRCFHCKRAAALKSINIVKDEQCIFRVRTKITEHTNEEGFLHPRLLPSKHKLTELIILEEHMSLCHAGVGPILTSLTKNFWLLKGRRTIKRIIVHCVPCRRHEAQGIVRAPVPLPEDRVRESAVFEVTGVDLAGTLVLKDGKMVWMVLFTSAVYCCIHLELIESLSTKVFLFALRRFISRGGDDGTNFVGANNLLDSINWKILNLWEFNPMTAAWWGEWW
ncbi:hypothetical protein PR048_003584 [Dryococelus australis]|uniref:Integrase zinc-binding domain-containing protein n=1 Tax=Dryococelus australis TaxID=614101 RepID=A0ABQ9IPS6_9NEOP|nr:hypothetical protein PR048_003584 [Dryococelus australis]